MKFIIWFAVWNLIGELQKWVDYKRGKPYKEYSEVAITVAFILDFMIMISIYNYFIK